MVRRAITNEIAVWLGVGTAEEMRSGTAVWANEAAGLARSRQSYRYLILRDGRFAGVIEVRPDALRGHVGYWLRRGARGRGTVTLANRLVLAIAYEGLGLKAVDWTADARNVASISVFERLGATRMGESPVTGVSGRTSEVRYRLARRAFSKSADGPDTLRDLLRTYV